MLKKQTTNFEFFKIYNPLSLRNVQDLRSLHIFYLDTHDERVRQSYSNMRLARQLERERFFKSIKLDSINISLGDSYIQPLSQYFINRAKKR